MYCCIIRKVPFRLPGSPRLVWALILAEREGLSLLLVPKANGESSHALAIAVEDVSQRVFHDVAASRFPLEHEDLAGIGNKLEAFGRGLSEDEFEKFFQADGLF